MSIPLLDPLSPPAEIRQVFDVIDTYTGWGDDQIFVFSTNATVVICRRSATKVKVSITQIELPTPAISWVVDTIEQGFWGGKLDRQTHQASEQFDGEEILITRQQNAGTDIAGFSVKNRSRVHHRYSDMVQGIQLCDPFLKESLLPELKRHFGG